MDLTLLAITDTALLTWAYLSWRQRERAGPAGRSAPLTHYQQRTLWCLALVLLCQLVATWRVASRAAPGLREIPGLAVLDVTSLAGLAVACAALRRGPTRGSVAAVGLGLGAWAASLGFAWLLVGLSATTDAGQQLVATVVAAWDIESGALGLVALFHYGLGAWLLAAGLAAHGLFVPLPAWRHDQAFRPVALLASLAALVYAVFTWRMW